VRVAVDDGIEPVTSPLREILSYVLS